MFKKNGTYLCRLPAGLLILAAASLLAYFCKRGVTTGTLSHIWLYGTWVFRIWGIFIGAGYVTGHLRTGFYSCLLFISLVAATDWFEYLDAGSTPESSNSGIYSFVFLVISYIFFVLHAAGSKWQNLLMVIAGTFAVCAAPAITAGVDLFLPDPENPGVYDPVKDLVITGSFFLTNALQLLLLADLAAPSGQQYSKGGWQTIRCDRDLPVAGTSVAFFLIHITLPLQALGFINIARELPMFYEQSSHSEIYTWLSAEMLLEIITSPFLLLLQIVYIRKLVLEHLIAYGLTSRQWLQGLLFPGVGLIAWILSFMPGCYEKRTIVRIRYFRRMSHPGSVSKIFILGLMILGSLLSLVLDPELPAFIILTGITAILIIFYTSSKAGAYGVCILFGAALLLYVFLLLVTDLPPSEPEYDEPVMRGSLLALYAVYSLLLLPVFHPTLFRHIPVQTSLPEQIEEGLFTDYPIE